MWNASNVVPEAKGNMIESFDAAPTLQDKDKVLFEE